MKLIITVMLFGLPHLLFSQSFEGEVVFALSYKIKSSKMSQEQAAKLLGTTQNYFIKQGNTKSVTNGIVQWQLYINKENKLYSKIKDSTVVYWVNAYLENEIILKHEIIKNADTILGYICDEVIITTKNKIYKNFYSSKLPIDPKLFKDDKMYVWYQYLLIAKALSLKTIIETPQLTAVSTAVKVKPMKLDDKIFELPKGCKLKEKKQ